MGLNFSINGNILVLLVVVLCTLLSVVAADVPKTDSSSDTSVNRSNTSICYRCQCLSMTDGYSADCDQAELTEIPRFRQDLHIPWLFRANGNNIRKVDKFPPFKNLTAIKLRNNIISQIADFAFAELSGLESLDLSHNNIKADVFAGKAFEGLNNDAGPNPLHIRFLNLSYNLITKLPEHTFEYLSKVQVLDLSHNHFFDLSQNTANAFTELTSLESLSLAFTKLRRLPDHFFAELDNLKELDLSGNNFAIIPPEVNYARHLQQLTLDKNLFGVITTDSFWSSLSGLKSLRLRNNEYLFKVDDGAFANLTSLEVLQLSNNMELEYFSTKAFGVEPIANLRELRLDGNHLEMISESSLAWHKIETVDISGNRWNCDCKFEWVAKGLAVAIQKRDRTLADNIICTSPANLQGLKVLDDIVQTDDFECHPVLHETLGKRTASNLAIATIIVGTLLLITALMGVLFVVFRRLKGQDWLGENVKYRRAVNDDEEAIATSPNY